jgi:hypothetical protein
MRRTLMSLLAAALVLPATSPARAAEERLVIHTAYEENALKDFWEQLKKDLPDLAAKASYIRGATGPTMARLEAERANPVLHTQAGAVARKQRPAVGFVPADCVVVKTGGGALEPDAESRLDQRRENIGR